MRREQVRNAERGARSGGKNPQSDCLSLRAPNSALRAPARIGLVAGWGRFPVVVAQALKTRGCEVHCVGLKNHADAALAQVAERYGAGQKKCFAG